MNRAYSISDYFYIFANINFYTALVPFRLEVSKSHGNEVLSIKSYKSHQVLCALLHIFNVCEYTWSSIEELRKNQEGISQDPVGLYMLAQNVLMVILIWKYSWLCFGRKLHFCEIYREVFANFSAKQQHDKLVRHFK